MAAFAQPFKLAIMAARAECSKGAIVDHSVLVAGQAVNVSTGRVPVHRILCPNAGVMTGPGTNSYLIGEQRLALIDPGPDLEAHIESILRVIGERELELILVTHTHQDHSPAASSLRSVTGARVVGMPPPEGALHQDPTLTPDRIVGHGEIIEGDGFSLQTVHTPGHVSNHICFLLEEDGLLFTGDHILQGTTPVILPPDGDMKAYLESLHSLRSLPLQALAPGHGRMMHEPVTVIDQLIAHRERRELKVLGVMQREAPALLDTLLVHVYDDVEAHLLPWARQTLLAHLLKLKDEGRARCEGPWDTALWSLADGVS